MFSCAEVLVRLWMMHVLHCLAGFVDVQMRHHAHDVMKGHLDKVLLWLQAGSDSLLTSSAFVKLASSRFKGFEQLQGHKGVLFGLGVDGNNEMVLTDH